MYARWTKFTVRRTCEADAEKALGELLEFIQQQPGFLMSLQLVSTENPREMARLSLWRSKAAADAAAVQTHSVAIRSRLVAAAREESSGYNVKSRSGRLPAVRKRKTV
ncbi:MAG: antibiotic biosynthesis monooxygenase [Chloroflexi bacterium]|nr:antibiotic biosynthesis monooxygenase [Chloroflexota bacterium]